MEKSKLETFITKYNLNGSCESVLYKVEKNNTYTKAISDDRNVLCEVIAPSFGLEIGEYPIYDTTKLRSLLGVVNENLSVKTKKSGDRFTGLEFGDGSTDVTFVLADSSVIPPVPDVKKLPSFDLVIDMDEKFITTFIKSRSALNNVETFTVISDGVDSTAQVILGFSSNNTNRIKLTAKTLAPSELQPISFSAKYLREILVANKDAGAGKLEISSKGLARTTFEVNGIRSVYHLVSIENEDSNN